MVHRNIPRTSKRFLDFLEDYGDLDSDVTDAELLEALQNRLAERGPQLRHSLEASRKFLRAAADLRL